MEIPNINKGNCFLFSVAFKKLNPTAQIVVCWNKESRIFSFSAILDGKRYFYKRKDRTQSKVWFNGKVVVVDLEKLNKAKQIIKEVKRRAIIKWLNI